tara:strand:+ start:7512 stop:7787 length:276 start_codon:yes stop_codon:yes gene_type:complete
MEETNFEVSLTEIDGKICRMLDSIEIVKERQEEIADDVSKIKEAVFHPDMGLYARLRELEQWKRTSNRVLWTMFLGGVSLLFAVAKHHFIS